MALCLECPWPCPKLFVLGKTLVFAVGRVINDRRGAGRADFMCPRRYEKAEPPVLGGSAIKTLDLGYPLLVSLPLEHAVEGTPGEFGAFDACGHVRDVLELGGLVQVFQVLLGELFAADHGEEEP